MFGFPDSPYTQLLLLNGIGKGRNPGHNKFSDEKT